MKRLILFSIIIILLSGCMTKKNWQRKYPLPQPSIETVIKEKVIYKDTIIPFYIKADTIIRTDTLIIDKQGKINLPMQRLDVEYAYSIVWVVNNNLKHELYQKDSIINQLIKDASKETVVTKEVTRYEPYPVYFEPTWWEKTKMNLGVVFLVLIIGTVGYGVYKLKPF